MFLDLNMVMSRSSYSSSKTQRGRSVGRKGWRLRRWAGNPGDAIGISRVGGCGCGSGCADADVGCMLL